MSLAPLWQGVTEQNQGQRSTLGYFTRLHLGGWLGTVVVLLVHFSAYPQLPVPSSLALAFAGTLLLFVCCSAIGRGYRHCLRWPLHCQLASMILGSTLITLVSLGALLQLHTLSGLAGTFGVRPNLGIFLVLSLAWSTLYFALGHFLARLNLQMQSSVTEKVSYRSQLSALEQQLNPHFLFNTLNAISTQMLKQDTRAARDTLHRLAAFLRRTLHPPGEKKTSLEEELSVAMMYLDIEKTRFDARLKVQLEVDDEVTGAAVPNLILLPLVVHAIKTAIAKMTKGGEILIQAKRHNSLLHLQVEDNGPDAEIRMDVSASIAACTEPLTFREPELQVVAQRLSVLYPRQHIFRLEKKPPEGLRVVMMIPYEEP